jgi:excisionase family DNA binding protein
MENLKLIDVRTLSNMLSIKPKTIYDYVRKGRIPYFKVEGSIRFEIMEIKKWLDNKHLALEYVIKNNDC